jgi:hypothetical protein
MHNYTGTTKNMTNNGNYSLEDALESFGKALEEEICCCRIGKIDKFYPETKTADIIIPMRKKLADGQILDNPRIIGVPILGNKITLPIEPGEYCLTFFNDFDIDLWFTSEHQGEPGTDRSHDITDAFAILGVNGLFNAVPNYDNENISLNGNTKVTGDLLVEKNITINVNVTISGDTDLGGKVTLSGKQPTDPNTFCCLPNCLFSGAVHTTNTTG